ncbi:hypothetical protein SAMN05421819_4083 [Bryocella elongata]|uniref:Uncharacterized protein n=1 Tax=Bryocella elongata TaxID=863522 RepID=A0A1H6BZ51_9BACT|nr:hypothetical protein [Bryocella elongata]SEG65942.1 hypothetical protein SAMN05421819_4083 [Bryocella elongata]
MSRKHLRTAAIALCLATPGLLASGLLSGCRSGCVSRESSEYPSPDGKIKAVLYEKECGDPSAATTTIALLQPGAVFSPDKIEESEIVYAADSNHGDAGTDAKGMLKMTVKWSDAEHLVVVTAPSARNFVLKMQHGPTQISYTLPLMN